jgi:hypothetical protein
MHSYSGTVALTFSEISVPTEEKKAELQQEYDEACEVFDSRFRKVIADQKSNLENQLEPKREGCLKSFLFMVITLGAIFYLASLVR